VKVRQGRSSFLKKRTKKLLVLWALALMVQRPAVNKSFLLLFFKKEALALKTYSTLRRVHRKVVDAGFRRHDVGRAVGHSP
jgi:hypothetical protein